MIYLDSNVFIYAATDSGTLGKAATRLLTQGLKDGACTSSLTLDEVLWAVAKKFDRALALEKARQLLALDIEVLPVERRDVEAALAHFQAGLDARDAIHASVALRRRCTAIASSDPSFAKVKGLKHLDY